MARRKTPRLAYCEYVSRDSGTSVEVWQARLQLLEATKRVYPIFLETLSTEVFPFYCELAEAGYNFDQLPGRASPYETLPQNCGLKSALSKWAAGFNAEAVWLMDEALIALRGWRVAPEWRKSLRWSSFRAVDSSSAPTGEAFEFRYPGWEMQLQRWSVYTNALRLCFEEKLLEYEKGGRELAESRGLVRARRKYSLKYFEWFVLNQFADLSTTKIVNACFESDPNSRVDSSTVLKGIKTAAKLIGWGHLMERKQNRKIG